MGVPVLMLIATYDSTAPRNQTVAWKKREQYMMGRRCFHTAAHSGLAGLDRS